MVIMVIDVADDESNNLSLLKAYYHPLFKVFHLHYFI